MRLTSRGPARRTCAQLLAPALATLSLAAIGCGSQRGFGDSGATGDGAQPDATTGDVAGGRDGAGDAVVVRPDANRDVVGPDVQLDPDAACASVAAMGTVSTLPVDIIWVVDNSSSMSPSIDQLTAGLNTFANLIASRGFDYHVVMVSLRGHGTVTSGGSTRYAVCIPPPLAGDSNCGNGPRFFQSSADIKSVQPLEQFLGTLGQTMGYTATDSRGGEPWRQFLRDNATKTIVVVTDDDSRLTADQFEHFAGGATPGSPSTSLFLPPGILDPSWNGLFNHYTFNGIYGWGSATNPATICTYPDNTQPPSSGTVYTTLVNRTMGARAQICSGASAWSPFFDSVATAVDQTSRVACDVTIPTPPDGSSIDPNRINVVLVGATRTLIGKVANMAACTSSGGWYYDDENNPTKVILCPSTCDAAQTSVRGQGHGVEVQFGCQTVPG